jgi:hypothetical protein
VNKQYKRHPPFVGGGALFKRHYIQDFRVDSTSNNTLFASVKTYCSGKKGTVTAPDASTNLIVASFLLFMNTLCFTMTSCTL